jgi:hypothetical protein
MPTGALRAGHGWERGRPDPHRCATEEMTELKLLVMSSPPEVI